MNASNTVIDTSVSEENALNSADWQSCPIMELYRQMDTLSARYYAALAMNNITLVKQLQSGIENLKAIIEVRDTEKPKYTTILI